MRRDDKRRPRNDAQRRAETPPATAAQRQAETPRGENRAGPASRLYQALTLLYPRPFRRRHGEDMQEMFEDIYRNEPESRGPAGRTRLAVDTARDLLAGVVVERLPAWDMLRQDLRFGLRRLRLHPTLSIAAILTLALGIGAVTTVFSFVNALVLDPLPYPEIDRIVAVGGLSPRETGLDGEGWLSPAEFDRVRALPAVDTVAALTPFFVTMTGDGDPEEVIGWTASPELFSIIGVRPVVGRAFTENDVADGAVVLGHTFWQRRFNGDRNVVGRRLRLGDRAMEVVGVLPRGAEWPMGTDLWVPLDLNAGQRGQLRVVARLASDDSLGQLRAQLTPIVADTARPAAEAPENRRIEAEPLLANVTVYTRTALAFLLGAAGLLLLLVCGNVANMQLAQASARRREMAVRRAMGAPRGRLVRQLLTESVALAALAGISGTLLAIWGAQGLRAALAHERWRFYFAGVEEIGLSLPVLVFTAAASLASVVLFGLVPALRSSGVDVDEALRATTAGGPRGGGRLRRGLVVLEVALSVALLFGAGLMAVSIGSLVSVDPRIDTGVFTARLRISGPGYDDPTRRRSFYEQVIDRVGAVPGVSSVALSNRSVIASGRGTEVATDPPVARPESAPRAQRHVVAGDYFGTLDIPVLRGRTFDSRDSDATDVVVVSERLASRLWPGESALGRRLRLGPDGGWLNVVGVAADLPSDWNDRRPAASAYVPYAQSPERRMGLLVRIDGDEATTADSMREAIWSVDPAVVVFAPQTIASTLAADAGPLRASSELVIGMAVAALLVSLSGVYALVAHAAGRRTREIGVRMALGAGRRQVVRMLVLEGVATSGLGLLIGLAIALAVGTLLRRFLQGAAATDAGLLLALAAAILALVAISSWIPARRAARMDPADTLRAE